MSVGIIDAPADNYLGVLTLGVGIDIIKRKQAYRRRGMHITENTIIFGLRDTFDSPSLICGGKPVCEICRRNPSGHASKICAVSSHLEG
jgi:hypothetical protein